MSEDEVEAYLAEPHLCTIGTHRRDGSMHLVAMNYGFLDGAPAFWTYRKAQKVKNLERDPRISMLVHSGRAYEELKGVQLTGRAEVIDDLARVLALADDMASRYGRSGTQGPARQSAAKRVAVRVVVEQVVSWDHTKLAGRY